MIEIKDDYFVIRNDQASLESWTTAVAEIPPTGPMGLTRMQVENPSVPHPRLHQPER